jgi:hypothetical protein
LGVSLTTISVQPYPVWFASGTACAFLFMRGTTTLPGICLGTFVAFYMANAGFLRSIECAMLFALQSYVLLWWNYKNKNVTLVFSRFKSFLSFTISTLTITALCSTLLVKLCDTSDYLSWWLANFNGILIIGCALMTWDAYFTQKEDLRRLNKGLLITLLLALLVASFTLKTICILVLTIAISILYGWCGAITALCIIAGTFTFTQQPPALFIPLLTLLAISTLGWTLLTAKLDPIFIFQYS